MTAFQIPSLQVMQGDKIRLQTKVSSSAVPCAMQLYITKVERAPDGTKVVWVSSQPPTKEDLTYTAK